MHNEVKAVVIKTPRLHETKVFYQTKLGLEITESSASHFVIRATGMRIVFVSVNHDVQVEMYVSSYVGERNHIEIIEDFNRIRFVVCEG
jgi:catechol-2,3-dioxygenase